MSRYTTFKKTSEILENIDSNRKDYFLIHYSCQNFTKTENGQSPRITAIAIQNFSNSQTHVFSIQKAKEFLKTDNLDEIEKKMLNQFYSFVSKNSDRYWVHWNMRDSNYGFQAIEQRYLVLSEGLDEPVIINDDKKIDLSRLLKNRFTRNYINHPRFLNLSKLNGIDKRGILSGSDEADAFDKGDYLSISHSCAAKVDTLSEILTLAIENRLKVNSSWFEIYGRNVIDLIEIFSSKPLGKIVIWFIGLILGIYIEKFFNF